MKDRVAWVEHRGVPVLHLDLSGLEDAEGLASAARAATAALRERVPGPHLVLVNLKGVPYSLRSVQVLREAAVRNRELVRARAVVGLSEVARFSFNSVARATGRPARLFAALRPALEWLLEQR